MSRPPATLERAFELARLGTLTLDEIATRLRQEHCDQVTAHLSSPSVRRDLKRLIAEANRVRSD